MNTSIFEPQNAAVAQRLSESPDELVYGLVAEAVNECLRAGQEPDVEALAAQYPELATQIRQLVPALAMLRQLELEAEAQGASSGLGAAALSPAGQLGDYRIIREIGRGGMGVVYEAEQMSLHRRIALKVLPFAAVLDPRQLQRFKNEAQAGASLKHPNIVGIYSVGCERGVHYYAMEFVEGQTLAQVIQALRQSAGLHVKIEDRGSKIEDRATVAAEAALPPSSILHPPSSTYSTYSTTPVAALSTERSTHPREYFRSAAHLGIQAAEALEHAHQMGVVHRDIKPSNLIVDAQGHLLVTDFGLAMTQKDPALTVTGDIMGTLRYMSPEQASGRSRMLDHHTDIYSLGVTLYELLTLRPPFTGDDRQQVLRQITDDEPSPPRQLNRAIPKDLETIVLKATAKEPHARYATAQHMADDLRRFLADQPIQARRPTLVDRAGKWARRHRPMVAAAAVVLLLTVVTLVASTLLIATAYDQEKTQRLTAQRSEARALTAEALAKKAEDLAKKQERLARKQEQLANQQRELAVAQRDLSERNLYVAHMRLAPRDWEQSQVGRLHKMLDRDIPEAGRDDLRGWEWYYHLSLCHGDLMTLRGHARQVVSVAWSPDGSRLASGDDDGDITVWNAGTGKASLTLREHAAAVWSVAWRPDGKRLASGSRDGTASIWDAVTGKRLFVFHGLGPIYSVAWSPDGRRLAVVGKNTVKIWDAATGQETLGFHAVGNIYSVAWSPDGRRLAVGGQGTFKNWHAATGQETLGLDAMATEPMALSSEGKRLVAGNCHIFDALTGRELLAFGENEDKFSFAWSPDGKWLAVGQWSNWARIFNPETGQCLLWLWHPGSVPSLAWSPDSKRLATASWAQRITVWDAKTGTEEISLRGHRGRVHSVSWSPDGSRLASGGADGTVKIWDPGGKQEPLTIHGAGARCLAWDPQGQRLASAGGAFSDDMEGRIARDPQGLRLASASGGKIRLWAPTSGNEVLSLNVPARTIAWGPNGKHLAAVTNDKAVILDVETGKELVTLPGGTMGTLPSGAMSWSPDGTRLAGWGSGETLKVWNARAPADLIFQREGPLRAVAWSPDGSRIATGEKGVVRIWDASAGKELLALRGHAHWIFSVAWSADGTRLASGGWDETVKVWDTSNGRELVTLRGHTGAVLVVGWSPDGKSLASASKDGTVRIWAPLAGQEVLSLAGSFLAWSPDGARLATIGDPEGTIRIYDASVGYAMARSPAFQAHVHEEKADEYLETGAVEKAIAEYGEAIRLDPKSPRACYARAEAYLKKGVFDIAAADLSKAIAVAPDAARVWHLRALARLGAGRADEYRKDCAEMLQHFAQAENANNAHWTAWTCALVPGAIGDHSQAIALAERAIKSDLVSAQYLDTLGAILYRGGRFEEAILRLTEAHRLVQEPSEQSRISPAYTWFFLAMAHHRLGHREEAKKWLDSAVAWTEKALHDHDTGVASLQWNRRLTLKLLREEAEALLKSAPAPQSPKPAAKEKEMTEAKPKAEGEEPKAES